MNLLQSILQNRQKGANPAQGTPAVGGQTPKPQGQGPTPQPANMPPMMGAQGPAGPGGSAPGAPPMPQAMPPKKPTPPPPIPATPQGLQGMNSITGMPIGGGAPQPATGPGANKPQQPMVDIPDAIMEKLKLEELMRMLRGG